MKKIVIQVNMVNDKCRSKALKVAAASQGVHSVSLEGENRDQVVVTGDTIDSVGLTNKLRKKFTYVTLISVADADASNNKESSDAGSGEEQNVETTSVENLPIAYFYSNFPPPPCPLYVVDHDPYPNICSIL